MMCRCAASAVSARECAEHREVLQSLKLSAVAGLVSLFSVFSCSSFCVQYFAVCVATLQ